MPDDPKEKEEKVIAPDPGDPKSKTSDDQPPKVEDEPSPQPPSTTLPAPTPTKTIEERTKDLLDKGYSIDTMAKMLSETRDEAASYRQRLKELKVADEKAKKLEAELNSKLQIEKELEKRLKSYEKKEEEAELAKKSEIERVTHHLQKANEDVEALRRQLEDEKSRGLELVDQMHKSNIINHVLFLAQQKGYKWRNEFEKDGLIVRVSTKREDGSFLPLEEVEEMVNKFIDANYQPPPAAPPGPTGTQTPKSRKEELQAELVEIHKLHPRTWTPETHQKKMEIMRELQSMSTET